MEAGRELDALVAEKVMGWVDLWADTPDAPMMGLPPEEQKAGVDGERIPFPDYSTDIAAAWQVVEKLIAGGLRIHLYYESLLDWRCVMHRESDFVTEFADTAPLAICLAALKALNISTN